MSTTIAKPDIQSGSSGFCLSIVKPDEPDKPPEVVPQKDKEENKERSNIFDFLLTTPIGIPKLSTPSSVDSIIDSVITSFTPPPPKKKGRGPGLKNKNKGDNKYRKPRGPNSKWNKDHSPSKKGNKKNNNNNSSFGESPQKRKRGRKTKLDADGNPLRKKYTKRFKKTRTEFWDDWDQPTFSNTTATATTVGVPAMSAGSNISSTSKTTVQQSHSGFVTGSTGNYMTVEFLIFYFIIKFI